ncbi:MAG: DNA polymerase IV [Chloroflexi bacterium]|nr:DNA polymerase IV [Chloroflexota bacterium]
MLEMFVMHADLDAFYASVEQLDNPALRGKPVLVGGNPQGRGVVASCSYEARKFGVRSAMSMAQAVRLCPEGITVHPRFHRYQEKSKEVMSIFREITPQVEPISLDEAFVDITHLVGKGIPTTAVGGNLKERVLVETGLVISVGIATSKSVAKIASDLSKPDGLLVVEPGHERTFLAPLPVKHLWGVGPKTEDRLRHEGILTLGDLAGQSVKWAEERFGKRGETLLALSRGEDARPVITEHEAKSLSAEVTFEKDLSDPMAITLQLSMLCLKVAMRLSKEGLRGRTVTVKLRLEDFTTLTRSTSLLVPTSHIFDIQRTAQQLLSKELRPGRRFRLLGVGVSNFAEVGQLSLLEPGLSR